MEVTHIGEVVSVCPSRCLIYETTDWILMKFSIGCFTLDFVKQKLNLNHSSYKMLTVQKCFL